MSQKENLLGKWINLHIDEKYGQVKNWYKADIRRQDSAPALPLSNQINALHPNVLWCSSVTPSSITQQGFTRQGSLFSPSVNQHPQADIPAPPARPHNTCHLIAFPQTPGLHLAPCPSALKAIKNQTVGY